MELLTCFAFLAHLIDLMSWVSRKNKQIKLFYFQDVTCQLICHKAYVHIPVGAVLLSFFILLNLFLYSTRRQCPHTPLPCKETERKQRTLIKKRISVFGNKGVDN